MANNINEKVLGLENKLSTQEAQITSIQAIMTFGFIISLITLGGVIIAAISFAVGEVNKTNQQTLILQEIKNKIGDESSVRDKSQPTPATEE